MLLGLVETGLVIVGAGPAGLGPLFAAASAGLLKDLLANGVTILEQSEEPGSGALDRYAIRSDSSAATFADIVMRSGDPRLLALRSHPLTLALLAAGNGPVPLVEVAAFLKLAGSTLCRIVADSPRGRVLTGVTALSVDRISASHWRTTYRYNESEVERSVTSHSVVLATGAHQPVDRLHHETVAGMPLFPHCAGRLMQSGEVFAADGTARIADRLRSLKNPKVAIIGGSTSAGAVAATLLHRLPGVRFGDSGVTILHRRPLRIFYETVSEALADGYTEFTPDDVCPLSGRVFRLGGFRLDSRDLMLRARGIGGRSRESRLSLLQLLPENQPTARQLLGDADLVIAALGYRPRLLPVYNRRAQRIALLEPTAQSWSAVDTACRVLNQEGLPLSGLFATGLAVGPGASRDLGGEAGFQGQTNSLWLWQNTLGLRIVHGALARSTAATALWQRPARTAAADASMLLSLVGGAA